MSSANDSSSKFDRAALLAQCEAEPIRTPGRLQSYGCLLIFDAGGRLCAFSENAAAMLGHEPLAVGLDAEQIIGLATWSAATDSMAGARKDQPPRDVILEGAPRALARRFELIAHRQGSEIYLEFLPRTDGPQVNDSRRERPPSDNLFRCALALAEEVQALTGYDRVMIYRFHPDWSGEVIAELRAPEMTPYLGLRYPASDIPSQARDLYLENRVRIIPNVHAQTVALAGSAHADLSRATLRAVSPYHLQYLRNMGVDATFTVSIVVDGGLWGMVACHHRGERLISFQTQRAASRVVNDFEHALEDERRRQDQISAASLDNALERWSHKLAKGDFASALLLGPGSILNEVEADGAALVFGDRCISLGATPETDWLIQAARMLDQGEDGVVVTNRISGLAVAASTSAAAGAMMTGLGPAQPCALFVFRRPQMQEVHWGGDPATAVQASAKDGKPSPRASFALWKETVIDQSVAWSTSQAALFEACAQALSHRLCVSGASQTVGAQMDALADRFLCLADGQRLLVDALPCGTAVLLWTQAETGPRLLYANRGFTELLGLELRDIVDQSPRRLLARTQLDAALLTLPLGQEVDADIWSPSRGLRNMRARRETVMRHCSATGQAIAIEGLLLNDATNDRRTQDALRSAIRQAETAERARGALMRNMSHELRTPLNAILGYSDLMALELCGPLGQDAYREAATEIAAGARHLLGLINDTLEMARLHEGKLRLVEGVHDLRAIIDQCLRLLQVLADKRGVTLRRAPGGAPLLAKVDETAIRQIAINLVNNALKFTEPGGVVEVTLVRDAAEGCVIAVRDTGIGIAPADLNKLFKPFSQIDDQLDRRQGGNGLGLAIVKSLARLHGATVEVDSQPGLGSTFCVRLPAWRMEPRT